MNKNSEGKFSPHTTLYIGAKIMKKIFTIIVIGAISYCIYNLQNINKVFASDTVLSAEQGMSLFFYTGILCVCIPILALILLRKK